MPSVPRWSLLVSINTEPGLNSRACSRAKSHEYAMPSTQTRRSKRRCQDLVHRNRGAAFMQVLSSATAHAIAGNEDGDAPGHARVDSRVYRRALAYDCRACQLRHLLRSNHGSFDWREISANRPASDRPNSRAGRARDSLVDWRDSPVPRRRPEFECGSRVPAPSCKTCPVAGSRDCHRPR